MRNLIYILVLTFFLSSCFKEEQARQAFTSFETIVIGNEYYNQVFYSLADTSIVANNNYLIWNLAFYNGSDKSYIKLNAAANMWVFKTNSTNFDNVFPINYSENDKRFDGSHGLDSYLAIDEIISPNSSSTDTIFSSGQVYLINPGVKANGEEIGDYIKFVFVGMFEDSYIIKYAQLDGANEKTISIPKNSTTNFTTYSWMDHVTVNVEPDKTTWDLLFSRFTDTVYRSSGGIELLVGYAVSGTYLNQYENKVKAYEIEDIPYEDINMQNIDLTKLSSNLNVIGHSWKEFNDQYSIYRNKSYIIQDRNGKLFKLHFLSFYDPISGQKGYASFEFKLL